MYPVGPPDARILLVGGAAGRVEAIKGAPFVGEAGFALDRLLKMVGWDRDTLRIGNIIACRPPNDWLVGAPWEGAAIRHCAPQLEALLDEGHKVVVTLGSSALRAVGGFPKSREKEGIRLNDFHGAPFRDKHDRFWIVPTFHPAFLLRGAQKLTKVVTFDLSVAGELAEGKWAYDLPSLIIDPPIDWFRAWADGYKTAITIDPLNTWLSVDVETPEKADANEDELLGEGGRIIRINFSSSIDEGITVPWAEPYISIAREIIEKSGTKCYWNCPTPDQRVLTRDLRWIAAGDLAIGDEIIGFDELPEEGRRARRYKASQVTATGRATGHVYAVCLSDGTAVKVTGEHPWLMKPPIGDGHHTYQWVQTKDLRIGWILQRFFHPWQLGDTYTHGYLAGFFDGEGHYTLDSTHHSMKVGAAQAFGPTYTSVCNMLIGIGTPHMEYRVNRAKDSHIGQIYIKGRTAETARFLGEVRPKRLLSKFKPEHLGAIQAYRKHDLKIVGIVDLGQQEIVTLGTSTKTYILEGFAAHNSPFDVKKLREAGIHSGGLTLDFMDGFKVLQSALPRPLGFVAPFYSRCPPWKHLGSKNLDYCAMDPVQALRCAHGITRDLHDQGLWDVFFRRMVQLDAICFRPAELVGMALDRGGLSSFSEKLKSEMVRLQGEAQAIVPEVVRPLSSPLVNRPEEEADIVERRVKALIRVCTRCGESEVSKVHKCADLKKAEAGVTIMQEQEVSRYYRRLPFNLGSRDQILAYVKFRKHKAGRAKKTGGDTVDKKTLKRLIRSGDVLYPMALEYRQASKMHGTYGKGILEHLDSADRIHPTFTNTPSTLRKASVNPNAQNLANHVKYANEFRRCVQAAPGCKLISADYSGIEAVQVGWLMGDPQYIKLAKLGIHAYVSTHHLKIDGLISEAADPNWSDADLKAMFKDVKGRFRDYYEKDKRVVHGVNYLLSEYGLVDYYPESFPKRADAARIISIYEEVCPKLRPWQKRTLKAAHEAHFLGGPLDRRSTTHDSWYWETINTYSHPFGYKHWFWDVVHFQRVSTGRWKESMGTDAKRTIAFGPQSQAMGTIGEAMLRLYTPPKSHPTYIPELHGEGGDARAFIGDTYFGETPLRAQIHDDITNEVPDHLVDETLRRIVAEMTKPITQMPMPSEWGLGEYLSIGVEVKVGRNWAPIDPECKWSADGNPDGMQVVGVESLASDVEPEDEDDED